ncbi:hypothetical protein BV898_14554 [Hypsibius exemplaris]|uniref:Uncharacterized protein n=1 Tax=Hypsibius exemplaris TaxID=2072580 RepID=A0A9X6NAT9_HYPEX|nr:hypothetical protein BV898_14554 [Hypsibius exemplaris]
MKIEKPSAPYQPAVNPYAKNGGGYGLLAKLQRKRDTNKGRRCRKVYGVEQRDKWCNMCKWKKACDRFADGANDSEIPDSPSPQSAKRANKYRPTVLPKKAAHLPDALELELPPPCDPTQALEALRVSV